MTTVTPSTARREFLPQAPDIADLIPADPGQDERPRRYKIKTAADALQPQPPIDWLVDGLFSAGSLYMVVGEGGSKKTWLCLDMAVSVAIGEPWLERDTIPGPVLIIDEESGNRRISGRLGDVLRGHQAGPDTPLYYVSLARFDLGQPDDINEITALILETGARLVIIDAMADIMPGRDENAVKDMQPILMSLRHVAETTQAALVMIHHNNKGGDYRGSTAIKGAVDLMLTVESKPDSPNIDISTEKARDIEPVKLAAAAYWGAGTFNLAPATPSSREWQLNKAARYVIRYLSQKGNATVNEIISAADVCSEPAAKAAIYTLADKGYLRRTNPGETTGGRGNQARYTLTEKGISYAENSL